jgi:hypothetical protein
MTAVQSDSPSRAIKGCHLEVTEQHGLVQRTEVLSGAALARSILVSSLLHQARWARFWHCEFATLRHVCVYVEPAFRDIWWHSGNIWHHSGNIWRDSGNIRRGADNNNNQHAYAGTTFGGIQGTFGVIQGTFGVIFGTVSFLPCAMSAFT